MIINSNPITAGVFDGIWISRLSIHWPGYGHQGMLHAELHPYDGTHLLATGTCRVSKHQLELDSTWLGILTDAQSWLAAAIQDETGVRSVHVKAPDPTRPVVMVARFLSGNSCHISDCFAYAASQPAFGQIFATTMAAVAAEAGFVTE